MHYNTANRVIYKLEKMLTNLKRLFGENRLGKAR